MIIRVKCNENIDLNQFHNLENIELNVLSYSLIDDTLSGDVKINGKYSMNNLENDFKNFENIVPFTVVFKDSHVKIDLVEIENKVFDIKEQGIDINFDLVVNYSMIDNSIKNDIIEIPVEIDEVVPVFQSENIETYNKIEKEYDKKLENLLSTRNTNVNMMMENMNNKVSFRNLQTKNNITSVYYFEKESDIERISRESRKTIQDIYAENNDLNQTRRIVIHE